MLTVVLGQTTPVYGPQELLTGDVVFKTPTVCRILDLKVNFCGESVVSFLASSGEGKSRVCEKVEETDIHLDVLHPLIKNYRGVTVNSGVHTYHFCLTLPPLLPTSYTSQYGHIDYYIDVRLQTCKGSYIARKPFVVKAPVNILLFPVSQTPQSAQVAKRYGLVSNRTLRLKASVFKTCLEPGDVASVFIETRNETKKQLKYLFCTLKKITTVLVHLQDETVERVTKENMKTEAHEVVGHDRYYSWHCQLDTPAHLTTTIGASSIIFVTYSIQVSAKLKRVTIPPEVEIPIVFGTRAPIFTERTRRQSECCTTDRTNNYNHCNQASTGSPRRRRVTVSSHGVGVGQRGSVTPRPSSRPDLAKTNLL